MTETTCAAGDCDKPRRYRDGRYRSRWCDMHAGRLQVHGSLEIPDREPHCERCGCRVQRTSVTGPDPRWCPDCKVLRRREKKRAAIAARIAVVLAAPIDCARCGGPFYRPTTVGGAPTHCPPCAKERDAETVNQWKLDNRERFLEIARKASATRRARLQAAEVEQFHDSEIFDRDRWMCGLCRKKIDPDLRWPDPLSVSLDHVVPLVAGGGHTRANVQAAHIGCNWQKNCRGGGEQLALIG